jgi:NAD(P)H dehydrogenase (quinone)
MTSALPVLAVTGATGFLGGAIAAQLASAGVPVRLLVRSLAKAPTLAGCVARVCAYSDFEQSRVALAGVETLLMVSASESQTRLEEQRTFIDAAQAAAVKHIAYTSFVGAAAQATFTLARDHYFTEQHIKAKGMAHTFLRDALYMDFVPLLVGDDGVIRGPAADGRAAIVSRTDIARTACAVLRDPSAHRNVTYNLTGPEALTMTEIANILSTAAGKAVRFHDETLTEAYESRKKWHAPDWQNDAWVSTYTAIAAGEMSTVSADIERITGQRAMTLAELLAAR